jgi:glycosyltransferase involved in cell wall biosynthesis
VINQIKHFILETQKRYQGNQYQKKIQKIIPRLPSEGIYINYGNVLPTDSSQIIYGGRVKILHLQEVFPEEINTFNILYLVSSAQPPFAEEIVQWVKKYGVKFVWNQNGVAYPAWTSREASRFSNRVMRNLIRQADYVIYQSEFCRESADRFLKQVSVPYNVLPNCVDTAFFFPAPSETPLTPWNLLTTGTHQQAERVLSVLRATALLKEKNREVRLTLAGRLDWPKAEQEVKEEIQKLDLRDQVNFYPPFTQEEAPDIYRQAQVFIHIKYKDPCPTVVIEAMACGIPVVGSKSGGMPELVGEEGGILIDVPESWEQMHYPSPEKIAEAVEKIFSDLHEYRVKARERAVAHFSKDRWVERHRDIFRKVL